MNVSISKYEIAKRLKVSPQAVYAWFSGKTLPSMANLIALAKLLSMSVEDTVKLLTEKDNNP